MIYQGSEGIRYAVEGGSRIEDRERANAQGIMVRRKVLKKEQKNTCGKEKSKGGLEASKTACSMISLALCIICTNQSSMPSFVPRTIIIIPTHYQFHASNAFTPVNLPYVHRLRRSGMSENPAITERSVCVKTRIVCRDQSLKGF
jgi:hypothetical protein